MRTYGGNLILSAHVSAPPPFTGARKGIWIDFEVAALGPTHEAIRAAWEADLVQGAVADNLAALGLGHVVGQRISIRLPDGTVAGNDPGGMGDITPGQQFQSPSDVVLKQTITDGLSAAGLSPVSVDVLHAAQPAPAVVAVSANPSQAAAAANQTVRDLFGQNPPKYEGAYFEVRDLKQNPVFILATSFRTGAGRLWFSSSVANDISLGHAGPARMGMRKTKETN
jgi:hypothetical protein